MSAFLVYILKVALLTAVFVLLYHLLLRRDTFHRTVRIVLVSSLVLSYILPFCVITIHKPAPVVERHEVAEIQTPVTLAAPQDNYQAQPVLQQSQVQMQPQLQTVTTAAANHRQIDWIAIAAVIYALGVVILITLRLLSVQKVLRIIRRGQATIERDGCRIVISKDNVRPFSWMRSIVLPESLANLSWTSPVVCHEYSHVSHHHSAELLATDILSAFQWFNPAVWLLRHDLCCVQEFQADASVLDSGLDKLEYEQSLLSIATGGLSIPLVNGLGESYLRTRIKMMNRKHSRKSSLIKFIYLPFVLAVALFLMSNIVFDINDADMTDKKPAANHEYVDLGLSVMWATSNVGAEKPEDSGDFFAWGETESKSNFLWENYRFYVSGNYFVKLVTADNKLRFSKYTFDQTYHDSIDHKTILDLSDDVAHVQWGGNWRMPTKEESKELIDDCTWTWTTVNGVNGYKVTSNKPGYTDRSIFLPAAGAIFDTIPRQVGSYGAYWINSLQTERTIPDINACTMEFHKGQIEEYWIWRVQGLPVRPVFPTGRNHNEVYETNYEPVADNTEIEPETAQTMLARFDGSFLESQVAPLSYQDNKVMPQNLPDIMLDNLKKQYPELNSLESIYDDGILTNDKPYKGYISCIQLSKGVYSFWVMGLEDKGGQVVSIELGTIDDAIAFLNNLVSSYKQGNTVFAQGHTLTGVRGNAYSVPRTDGVEPGPYLVSVKNLKHDLSVLEKRKNWGTANYDEIAFFTMENKPDHYEVLNPLSPTTYEYLETNTWEGVDGGEEWARTELEKQIREHGGEGHVPGKSEWARSRFNGVILLPLQKSEYMKQSGAYREYVQFYIPIIYDPEKYQAPLTDYQRSLKRSVFRRDSKKDKTGKDASYNEVGFFTMENKPDEYEVLFHDSRPAEMTLTEREDGGSGESWAATEIEKKIRDLASLGIHKDMANTRFNGVILVGELYRGYDLVFGTWYRQYYIPINYDQEKYQAPLTDYQRGLKRSVFRRKK